MMGDWMHMEGYGAGHLLFLIVMAVVFLYPIGRILSRIGLSPLWSVLAFIPIVNLVALWVLAFAEWPAESRAR